MNFNAAITKLVTNKWVLNVVAILALFNVIGYLVMGHLNSVLYFVVFAVLVRYFSKNMTIVLGVPLLLINLLSLRGNLLEGMETKDDTPTKPKTVSKDKDKPNPLTVPAKKTANDNQELVASSVASNDGNAQQGFESGRRKNRGYNIDYATTIEDAYDELNTILGSDGIQRLTTDSQNLMKQQMQLAESMKGMGQLVQNIQPMVEQLKGMMGDSNNGLSGVMDLAKQMSGSSQAK